MTEEKINTQKWFWIFCSLHVFLWTVIPTIFFPTLYGDTVESIAWGYQWQWGYTKHPPLAAWIAAFAANIGPFTEFQIYLIASLLTVLTFWAIWKLAGKILTPGRALIAVLLLEGAIYYNCYSVYIDPDMVQLPIWALIALTFYIALKGEKIYQWLLVGFFCALAVYAKYQAMLIFIPMFVISLATVEGRKNYLKPGIYLCFIFFLIIIAPHFIWAYFNNFPAINYAYDATHGMNAAARFTFGQSLFSSLNFLLAQIGFCVLLILLTLTFLFVKRDKAYSVGSFNKRYILILGLGPLAVAMLYPIIARSEVLPRWGWSIFSLIGIIFISFIKPTVTKKVFYRFAKQLFVVICFIALSYCIFYGYWFSYVNGNYRNWNLFPSKAIAEKVTDIWDEQYKTPLKYIAGSHYLIVGITVYSKDHPIPYLDWNEKEALWMNVTDMRKDGAMFAWWVDGLDTGSDVKLIPAVKKRFPKAQMLGVYRFKKTGIPKDNRPILKNWIENNYPDWLENPLINQFFPNYPPYVDIGIAILPPGSKG